MKKGILYTIGAYLIWGFFPILFKSVVEVPAVQIVAHRIVWSFVCVILLVFVLRSLAPLRRSITRRTLLIYGAAAVLATVNWLTFVWAVNSGYVLEASLGYFINPLVSVLLGVVFLRERLRPLQWLPVGLAAVGVVYLVLSYGGLLWISLVLAVCFGLYGLVKKIAPLGALHGLALETGLTLLPALAFLVFEAAAGRGSFGIAHPLTSLLLIFAGIATAAPLLLFSAGTQLVPLSIIGLLQYISPTLQFLCGVLLYNEPFTRQRLVGFCIIWLALLIFSAESLLRRQKAVAVEFI